MRLNWKLILVLGLLGAVFFNYDRRDAMVPINAARALCQTVGSNSGDSGSFEDRFLGNYADFADRERQAQWSKAYGFEPGGFVLRMVSLPYGFPNAKDTANQICQNLLNHGFADKIDSKFPSLAIANSHQTTLEIHEIGNPPIQIIINFSYSGFVRRGDPRKAVDYGRSLVIKAVADRCSDFPSYERPVPLEIDASQTAIITDLPDEPQTMIAIAKMAGLPPPPQPARNRAVDYYGKGNDCLRDKDYSAAASAFNEACKTDPTFSVPFFCRGELYARSGDYDAALEDYHQALKLDPNQPDVLMACGIAHVGKHDLQAAIADYNDALELDPDLCQAYLLRSIAYLAKSDIPHAISDAGHCIEHDPDSFKGFYARGTAEALARNLEPAINDFEKGLQIDPKMEVAEFAYVSTLCAGAYASEGKYDKAILHYQDAISANPDCVIAYNDRAWLLATCPQDSVRDGSKAVLDATQANILTNWQSPAFLDTLAAACAEAGDFDSAIKWEVQCMQWPGLAPTIAAAAKARLALYQSHQPYRAPVIAGGASPTAATAAQVLVTPNPAVPSAIVSLPAPIQSEPQAPVEEPSAPAIPSHPHWTWSTYDGKVYQDVVVIKIEASAVTITHSLGVAQIPVYLLPPELKKQLNYR